MKPRRTHMSYCHSKLFVIFSQIVTFLIIAAVGPNGLAFEFDPNNPASIAINSSVTISVTGGTPPFSWSVTGSGFSFSTSQTDEPSNLLSATNTACGAAAFIVADSLGNKITGAITCNSGKWLSSHIIPGNFDGSNCSCCYVGCHKSL
jgi:hypothetical protein